MKTISTFNAKNNLSKVIADAEAGNPSVITKNGRKAAVLVSYGEFERLATKRPNLGTILRNSPLRGSGIDLSRSEDLGRETVDFSE